MAAGRRATRIAWWPAALIIGAACAFCWPVFLGRVMLPADMCLLMLPWRALADQFPGFERPHNPMLDPIQQYLPWRIYAVESLRGGLVPLWNPYAFCGTPFLANLQSTVLYPLNVLFLVTGARHGFGISAILHLCLGGLFAYAFFRTLRLARAAALLGGLVVMFNGFTVTWLEYPTLSLWVYLWLPGVLLCYEGSLERPRSVWPVLCALVIGLQFLGGHLQISAYVIIAFLVYAVIRVVVRAGPPGSRFAAGALALVPFAVGCGLAAAQILPTLELSSHSGRMAQGAGAAMKTAFPPSHLVLYFVPNFFGNPVDYNYWGSFRGPSAFNFFETACYVGILPLLLGAWAVRRWREPAFWFFAALTAFAVLAAVGSPVYLVLYYALPGFRELAGLGRILCLAAFGLAGLAALGLDDLLRRHEPARALPVVAIAALSLLGIGAALYVFQPAIAELPAELDFPAYLLGQLGFFLLLMGAGAALVILRARARLGLRPFAGLAIALVTVDLFGFGLRFNPFTDSRIAYPETESTRWLSDQVGHFRFTSLASDGLDWMPHNAPTVFGLRDIHGSDSLRVHRSFELVSPPGRSQSTYPDPDSPLMDALGVRYLMTRREVSAPWRLVRDAEAPIYENPEAMPRAYLLAADDPAPSPVRFLDDEPDRVVLRARCQRDAILVLTDSYYPGWRAWVDGRPASVRRIEDAFRGVALPPGEHSVEMRYDPASFRVGLFLSLLALALVAGSASALLIAARS